MALSDPDRQAIRERLATEMQAVVTLEVFVRDEPPADSGNSEGPSRTQAFRELLEDVGNLSSKLSVVLHRWQDDDPRARALGVMRAPAVAIVGDGVRGRMIQYGTPAGYEFKSFLAGIIAASRAAASTLDAESQEIIDDLPSSLHLQIFTSPGCPHCPRMASVAFELAVASERFVVDVIDITEFTDMARRYAVQGIPLTVVNDAVEMVGAMPRPVFLKKLLRENVPPQRPSQ
jgi:glutaredoxin-like protein